MTATSPSTATNIAQSLHCITTSWMSSREKSECERVSITSFLLLQLWWELHRSEIRWGGWFYYWFLLDSIQQYIEESWAVDCLCLSLHFQISSKSYPQILLWQCKIHTILSHSRQKIAFRGEKCALSKRHVSVLECERICCEYGDEDDMLNCLVIEE